MIEYYKEKGQCVANITSGGYGGCNFIWTDEMREYKSKYNPMKEDKQRMRMSINNPMKNPEVAKKCGQTHKRPVIINNIRYDGTVDAARELHLSTQTILSWLTRGFNSNNNPCRYENEKQKQYTPIKRGKSVIVDGIEYATLTIAAESLGVTPSGLSYALKHSGICKGHKCEYANQQPNQ